MRLESLPRSTCAHIMALVERNSEVVDEWHFNEAVTAENVKLFPQNGNGHVLTLRESEQFDIISRYNFVKCHSSTTSQFSATCACACIHACKCVNVHMRVWCVCVVRGYRIF